MNEKGFIHNSDWKGSGFFSVSRLTHLTWNDELLCIDIYIDGNENDVYHLKPYV